MAVYKDKAYLFTGRPLADYFDLVTEQWGTLPTKFKRDSGLKNGDTRDIMCMNTPCKWQKANLTSWGGGGGVHDDAALGCNLFMRLDLETRQWERLSGTVLAQADNICPGPR